MSFTYQCAAIVLYAVDKYIIGIMIASNNKILVIFEDIKKVFNYLIGIYVHNDLCGTMMMYAVDK